MNIFKKLFRCLFNKPVIKVDKNEIEDRIVEYMCDVQEPIKYALNFDDVFDGYGVFVTKQMYSKFLKTNYKARRKLDCVKCKEMQDGVVSSETKYFMGVVTAVNPEPGTITISNPQWREGVRSKLAKQLNFKVEQLDVICFTNSMKSLKNVRKLVQYDFN